MRNLRELEEQFFRALQRPHGSPADPALVGMVEDRAPLDGAARIDIYAHMYCSRIIGSLLEDYPAVAGVLGAEAFDTLAHAYLEAHPSTHASLRQAGAHLPGFLAGLPTGCVPAFVPDLARLEWAQLEVFDAADVPLLTLADLQAIAPEEWSAFGLRLAPAVRLLTVAWPVHRCVDDAPRAVVLQPAETALRVWRKDFGVFVSAPDDIERRGLQALQAGRSFGALCEDLAMTLDDEVAAQTAAGLVVRWIEDEILVMEG